MSNVSAHLYEYRRKARPRPSSRAPFLFPDLCTPPPHPPQVVRDLAWALASPHILSDDVDAHGVRVYSDDDARRALAESRAWLSSLDDDPAHLLRWVASQRGSNKLGFYFGALIEYAARFCPAIAAEAVTVHRQVAHDLGAGRMVGQLKLVAKRPDRTARRRDDAREKSSRSSSKAAGDEDERDDFPDDFSRDDFSDDFAASEVLHWEFNVKYFVDGGSVDSPTRRATRDTRREDVATSPASHTGVSLSCPSDPAEPSANEPPLRAPNDDADDAAFDAAGLARPPSGDSCYVGPFLHENLHVRVSEARRKLALAGHPRVDGWLARWAAGRLEGEETLDPNGVPIVPREADAGVDAEGENPRGFRRRRVSEQILRGYLFYPLRGDERGGGSWARTRPRGHASANHLRGWWVTDPDEIALVPESHEDDPSDPTRAFLGERRSVGAPNGAPNAPSGCSDRMWAVLTRKCHWLGPCEAEHVPGDGSASDGSSSDPPPRDGATTPWIVRGVPELGIRDVEVVPTRLVADAAREVLRASDRGVLIAELIGPFRRSTDGASVWRERSRGFVLPKRWDPWRTVLRRDPFRRRYERGKLTAEELEDETAPEGTFEVMYPDRLDVDELGDDVRVGPRRVFRGNISWKTERDPVRVSRRWTKPETTIRRLTFRARVRPRRQSRRGILTRSLEPPPRTFPLPPRFAIARRSRNGRTRRIRWTAVSIRNDGAPPAPNAQISVRVSPPPRPRPRPPIPRRRFWRKCARWWARRGAYPAPPGRTSSERSVNLEGSANRPPTETETGTTSRSRTKICAARRPPRRPRDRDASNANEQRRARWSPPPLEARRRAW